MEMIVGSARRAQEARERTPLARPQNPGPHGRLRAALAAPGAAARKADVAAPLAVIAEIKRRSPSKGDIAPDLDAVDAGASLRGGRRRGDLGADRAGPLRGFP